MPTPTMAEDQIGEVVRQALTRCRKRRSSKFIRFSLDDFDKLEDPALKVRCDRGQLIRR